jgi:AraC family mar-sox-rob regulon transcriptional activator
MAKTDEVVSPKMIPVVQGIVDWIEAHIFDTLPVSAIAKKSGYSHWYFQRQFAMVTGCTLASYVSRRKMTIATIYLTQTEASMQSISQCLGYDGTGRFLPDLSPSLWHVAHPLSSGSAGQRGICSIP